MILTEIKITGVNRAVAWLTKKFEKLGYAVKITHKGSVSVQYMHVINDTKSTTVKIYDPLLPPEQGISVDYDYTYIVGVDTMSAKQKKKMRLDKPKTTIKIEDALAFVKKELG